MEKRTISITKSDLRRLLALLEKSEEVSGRDQQHLQNLEEELGKAEILNSRKVPPDLVTMNSQVRVFDFASRKSAEYTLVFPAEADNSMGRISVLAPVGTAMLGYRVGDTFQWKLPFGIRRFKIEAVRHQSEAIKALAG